MWVWNWEKSWRRQRCFHSQTCRVRCALFSISALQHSCCYTLSCTLPCTVRSSSHTNTHTQIHTHCPRQVRDKLLEACCSQGVEVRFNCSLEGLRPMHAPASSVSDSDVDLHSVSSRDEERRRSGFSASSSRGALSNTGSEGSGETHSTLNGSTVSSNPESSSSLESSSIESSSSESSSVESNSSGDTTPRHQWLCRMSGEGGGELVADKLVG